MKAMLMIIAYSILMSLSMSHTRPGSDNAHASIITLSTSIHSTSEVMPLLQIKCSPCHFEGGKMYAKMPFDKISTLITHEKGMLKRLNDENEKALLKKFIEEHKGGK